MYIYSFQFGALKVRFLAKKSQKGAVYHIRIIHISLSAALKLQPNLVNLMSSGLGVYFDSSVGRLIGR